MRADEARAAGHEDAFHVRASPGSILD